MANSKADFSNPEFTGLASRCWAVFASTYNPSRIIDMYREVQVMEAKRDHLRELLDMELNGESETK